MESNVASTVKKFYEAMPFNYYVSVSEAERNLQDNAIESTYPDLDQILASPEINTVLEVGCGCGWLTNLMAMHYDVEIVALDMTEAALQRAEEISNALGVGHKVSYQPGNLFTYEPGRQFDLVVSIGVLHHTEDCERAFKRVQNWADQLVYVGLYHLYGREVFLKMFHDIMAKDGEEAAYQRYREIDSVRSADDIHLKSWFRDQVLHPHETQHTLQEVNDWMADTDLQLISTSVNRFSPFESLEELFEQEKTFAEVSRQANYVEGRYYPGFFTALAERSTQGGSA